MEKKSKIPDVVQGLEEVAQSESTDVEINSDEVKKYTIKDVPREYIDLFEDEWCSQPNVVQQNAKTPKPMFTNDSYALYLNDVIKTPLLTKDGETVLSHYIELGVDADPESTEHYRRIWAKDKLIKSNLRLAVKYARTYMRDDNVTLLMDIIQEATIGLDRAAEKFNWRRGFKFSTYATWWIRQSVNRFLAKETSVYMPSKVYEQIKSLTTIENSLMSTGVKPSNEYLARMLGVSEQEFYRLITTRGMMSTASLDKKVDLESSGNDSDPTLGTLIGEEDEGYQIVESRFATSALQKALANLSERAREVIERRYGLGDYEPHTLDEIGKVYGLTRERVRQIENKALRDLREIENIAELTNFLS